MVGAAAGRLFKSQILGPAEIEQTADRRVAVGTVEQHAADDFDRRPQRHRIGGIPAGGMHGAQHVRLVADQPDIDRIAGNALRGPRHHRQSGEPLLMLVMRPDRRQDEIGEQAIGDQEQQQELQDQAEPAALHR